MFVRTWLLPQNFKAHKATKQEGKKLSAFSVKFKMLHRGGWGIKKQVDWVTILMKGLMLKFYWTHFSALVDIWWKVSVHGSPSATRNDSLLILSIDIRFIFGIVTSVKQRGRKIKFLSTINVLSLNFFSSKKKRF